MSATDTPPLSQRELTSWASLATTLIINFIFFGLTVTNQVAASAQVDLLVGLVVAQVIIMIGISAVASIRRGNQPVDERDRLIDLRSFRAAYYVLSIAVASVATIYLLWLAAADAPGAAAQGLNRPGVALMGRGLLLCFVAAEIAKTGTQVFLYRRGAS